MKNAYFNKQKYLEKFRPLLAPLSIMFLGLFLLRDFLYKLGILSKKKLPCKVISVGNISSGGTGKTPFVIMLASFFQSKGISVGILSRGYKRKGFGPLLVTDGFSKSSEWQLCGDEPALMAKRLEGIPIVVDKKRIRGGLFLIKKFNPKVIILDDAFQHKAIYRNLDIVLINSSLHTNNHGKLLPLGSLREPWSCIKRAHLIIASKINLSKNPHQTLKKIKKTSLPYFQSSIGLNRKLVGCDEKTPMTIRQLKGVQVMLVSGIGDSNSFQTLVEKTGAIIVENLMYSDHYSYTKKDHEIIFTRKDKINAQLILTTEKDFIKLKSFKKSAALFALPIKFSLKQNNIKRILDFIK